LEEFANHYPVEHWLFGRSRIYRQMILAAFDEKWSTQRCCRSASFESKPAFHGPVPAGTTGLLLFRFEGAALGVDPW
jgi:hypothetical protein